MAWTTVLSQAAGMIALALALVRVEAASGPIRVSLNGRYFVTAQGEAYYTCLAGGFHGYGHNDSWRVKPRWRAALEDPAAQQMTVLKNIITGLPKWWTLVPDPSVITRGGNTRGEALNLGAASAEGQWLLAYLAGQPNVTIDLARITAADWAAAAWIDPVTGHEQVIGRLPTGRAQPFTRPADWQDAVLVMKAVADRSPDPVEPPAAKPSPAAPGPLRVHPSNPRYFTDGSGKFRLYIPSKVVNLVA